MNEARLFTRYRETQHTVLETVPSPFGSGIWEQRLDLNLHIPAYEAGPLTIVVRCHGAAARQRSENLSLKRRLLCQLSYDGEGLNRGDGEIRTHA